MKFTRSRTFSRSLLILVGCCNAMIVSVASSAAPDRPSAATADRSPLLGWVQLSPTNSPPARSYLAMTYDPVSGRIIMFGGFDGNGYLNDTWEFNGVTWTQITTNTPPPARSAAQMAYDSVARKVVLYGDLMEQITWEIPGFGMEQLHSGHKPHRRISLPQLRVRCCSRIQMAMSIILADSLRRSTN